MSLSVQRRVAIQLIEDGDLFYLPEECDEENACEAPSSTSGPRILSSSHPPSDPRTPPPPPHPPSSSASSGPLRPPPSKDHRLLRELMDRVVELEDALAKMQAALAKAKGTAKGNGKARLVVKAKSKKR